MTVAAGLARSLLAMAVERGASRRTLLRASGIAAADLEDVDARLPFGCYVDLMRAAKALTQDCALPLEFGSSVDMGEFSVVGMIFRTCETVQESLHQINRYGRLIVEVETREPERFQFARCERGLWLIDTRSDPLYFPELTETTFARFAGMTRPVAGQLIREVNVTHEEPPHRAAYDAVFQAPVRFSAKWNAMLLDEKRLTLPIRQEPRYAFGIFSDRAEALCARLEHARSVRGQVEKAILPILHSGEVTAQEVARRLGVGRQTLYRRLKAEGVTFGAVLDRLRQSLATDYLTGGKLAVNEVAYLVGFSEPAAFSRAFKRWTGLSPRQLKAPEREPGIGGTPPEEC